MKLIQKTPFYLIFFALFYSLTKFLPFTNLFLLFFLFILAEGLTFALIYYLARDIRRAGFHTFLIFAWILYFGTAAHIIQSLLHIKYNLGFLLFFLIPWTLVFWTLSLKWLWRKREFSGTVTPYLNLLTAAIVLVAGYRLLFNLNYRYFEPASPLTNFKEKPEVYPDIYYIILDGYGREDTLLKYLNFDNSEFANYLEQRGFKIASQSQANYLHTTLSISSALNMGYINPTANFLHLTAYKEKTISRNQVSSYLKTLGYQFVTFYNPYELTDITDSDIYFSSQSQFTTLSMRMAALLSPGSLAAVLLEAELISPLGTYQDNQDYLITSLNQLPQIHALPRPKFIF